MEEQEHRERHELLQKHLDELLADFITDTHKLPSQVTLLEFLDWSAKQSKTPNIDN